MVDTNINPESLSEQKPDTSIPVSPVIPKTTPDLSTGGTGGFVTPSGDSFRVNQDTVPAQESKKESFYFGNEKVNIDIPKENTISSPIKEAFKKEEKARIILNKASNPKLKKNIIAAVVAVFLLVLLGGGGYYFYSINKKIPVSLSVNQQDFSLFVDGNEYKNLNSPYQLILSKGEHTLTVRKDGFADLQKTITVSPTKGNFNISFELSAYQKIETLVNKELFFPVYNKELDSLSYFDTGENGYDLKEFNFGTQKVETLITGVGQINKVVWSPTFKQLDVKITNTSTSKGVQIPYLEKYGEGTKVNWIVNLERRDLINVTIKNLNPAIKNITFSPQGDKIAYFFQSESVKNLAVANTDGSNYEIIVPAITTISFEPDLAWSPDGNQIAIFANTENGASSTAGEVNVYLYNFQGRSIAKITEDGISTGALFSPDGTKLLYQSGNNIMLYDLSTAEGKILDPILQASLSNCSWVDNTSFVALSNSDNTLVLVKTSGVKEPINYQKDTLPTNIKSIITGNGKIYIFNNQSVYQLILEKNI